MVRGKGAERRGTDETLTSTRSRSLLPPTERATARPPVPSLPAASTRSRSRTSRRRRVPFPLRRRVRSALSLSGSDRYSPSILGRCRSAGEEAQDSLRHFRMLTSFIDVSGAGRNADPFSSSSQSFVRLSVLPCLLPSRRDANFDWVG